MSFSARVIFLTRHGDLRSGWKMLLFILLGSVLLLGLGWVALALHAGGEYVQLALALGALGVTTWIMTRMVNRKPFSAVGLAVRPPVRREIALGLLLGFLMMSGIFIAHLSLGFVRITVIAPSWGSAALVIGESFLLFALAAFLEEFLFRGYLFQTLIQGVTFLPATLIFAVLFALAHLRNPNVTPVGLVNIALAGIWLSFAYMKTRRLWLPFALHLSWNFTQTTVFGFPTSGLEMGRRKIVDSVVSGPDWITGGTFGPEGGVLASIAILLCTWHLLKSSWYAVPAGCVTLDSIEDLLPQEAAEGTGA
jgi:membrane protease YdiL (CAAX protease family)